MNLNLTFKFLFFAFIFSIISSITKAQFIEVSLISNPTIENRYKKGLWKTSKTGDTLELPFFDDFAKTKIYPDSTLWENNYVYVNETFGLNPPTVGVATFDMLNEKGLIYENATSDGFYADTLTSKPINTLYPGDTTIIFSFWYQPQGIAANKPETYDSLILQFFSPDSNRWYNVWATPGSEVSEFKIVLIKLDSIFLSNAFKFRFINKASIADNSIPSWASNGDYWNIDLVYLDRNRTLNDSTIDDVAILTPIGSPFLYNYQSVPWKHFSPSTFLITDPNDNAYYDLSSIKYCNHSTDSANIGKYLTVKEIITDSIVYPVSELGNENIFSNECKEFTPFYQGNIFPNIIADSAEFEIKFYIKYDTISGLRALYRWNDTIYRNQRFYDYYAYDDGSAESGAGLYGVGTSFAYLAYKFKSYKADTLRAVKIFFNRTLNNANRKYFILTVWEDNNGEPGNILYQQIGYRPEFKDSLNAFYTYLLDTAIFIDSAQVFYIGWERTTEDFLNVGFDKNNNVNNLIFYNIYGYWENSPLQGALMVRPVFSKEEYLNTNTHKTKKQEASIFPNPTNKTVYITYNLPPYYYYIYDLSGKKVFEGKSHTQTSKLNIQNLHPGIYFVKIKDGKQRTTTKKLVISR